MVFMNDDKDELVTTTIAIRASQREWLKEHEYFNLAGFVRDQLDRVMTEKKGSS